MSGENSITAGLMALGVLLTSVMTLLQTPGLQHLSDITDVQWAMAIVGSGLSFLGSYHTVKTRRFAAEKILNTSTNYIKVSDIPTLGMSQKVGPEDLN